MISEPPWLILRSPTPPPSNPPSNPLIFLSIPVSTKLNRTNFLAWQSQIVPILHGYGLHKFIIEPASDENKQLLLRWLRSSLSQTLLGQVLSCTSSFDLWTTLQSTFSVTSKACLVELRRKLFNTTKKGMNCTNNITAMRSIVDELAFIGYLVSDEDLAMHILGGLGSEFNSFVVAAITSSQHNGLSLPDIQAGLLSHENLLQTQHTSSSSLPSVSDPTALYTNNQKSKYSGSKPANQNYPIQ